MNPESAQARSPAPPHSAMMAHLLAQAGPGGLLSFRDFMAAALYAPSLGYYRRQDRTRVGRQPGSDFYTSSSLAGGVFGQLLKTAAAHLLHPTPPHGYSLVELAAEPGAGVFGSNAAPFAQAQTRHFGDSLTPPPLAIVFANEWLDAQPFHRFVFRQGRWRELGVKVDGQSLVETELPKISPPAQVFAQTLPSEATEGYHLDLSLDAEIQLRYLAATSWKGVLILADYGYDWAALIHERPAGTGRAYSRHQVSGDLLASPGEQDLTCHVCWDRLENVLRQTGFTSVQVERQESFFMRHAATEIEKILSSQPGQFSRERQTLLELLHPAHLGQKFQILSARRA